MGQQEKEFDRSVCFSFFEDYCQHVENVEKEFGIETAYKVIMAIVKYGLYEEEPEDSKMKILVNKTILKSIDLSQKRRSRGFSGEDLEKTQNVIDYYCDHPDASKNEIAKATGISKGKVNKVIRKIKEEELNNSNSNSIFYSNANSSMTVTVTGSTESHIEDASLNADAPKPDTKKKKKPEYVITKEIKEQIWQMFEDGYKYADIESETGVKGGKIYSIIEDLKKEKEEEKQEEKDSEQKEKQKRAEERLNLEANRMIEESKKTKSENLILSKFDDFKRLDFGSSMTNIDILNIIERTYYASKSNGTISDIKQAITDEFQDWPYSCRNIDAIGKCIDYLDNISV